MSRPSLPRRTWLRLAATALAGTPALIAAGCALPRAPRPAAPPGRRPSSTTRGSSAPASSSAAALDLPVEDPFTASPALLTRFNATHPAVMVTPWSHLVPVSLDSVVQGNQLPLEPLDTPLRALNFDPGILLPGSVQAFTTSGGIVALPTSLRPLCVAWRPDAFAAAGLPDPDAQWTLEAFESACAALQGVVSAGKIKGLAAVLSAMVGQEYKILDTSNNSAQFLSGKLTTPGLWEGFALGFGGTVIDQGRFVLTDPGTAAGLAQLVNLAARYGLPPALVPTRLDGISNLFDLFALDFLAYEPEVASLYGPKWRFARLPLFPVTPVIPTLFVGAGLNAPPGMPADIIDPYESAAVEFVTWSYGAEAQALLAAAGVAPVLADAAIQKGFWTAASGNAEAIGDWRHFVNFAAGWPADPPSQIMADALTQAVQAPATLATLLAQAEQAMNAAVAGAPAASS